MTLAAKELFVTPGAVSKQVKVLEAWLGAPLFEGTKNNPVLTTVGKALLPKLTNAFTLLRHAANAAAQHNNNSLHVACYNTFAAKWLLPRMHALHTTHPHMDVHLSTAKDIDTARPPECDVVILAQPAHASLQAGMLRSVLFTEYLGPVLSPELQQKKPVRRSRDLPKACLLNTQTRPLAWTTWAQSSGNPAPAPNSKLHYPHYYAALEAALRGLGVCVAPWHLVCDDIQAHRLVAPLGFSPSPLQYVALVRAEARPVVKAFSDWLSLQAQLSTAPPASPV